MSKHRHKFTDAPEIRGVKCACGVVRFATVHGAAEYDGKTTKRISDGKVLYKKATPTSKQEKE